MLGFNRKAISAAEQNADDALVAMKSAVENAKENNPFVVYEATGNDLVYAIFDIAKTDDGVHLEHALGIIGALAGYSCAIAAGLLAEQSQSRDTGCAQTEKLNGLLYKNSASFYRVLENKAAALGAQGRFDLQATFAHHNTNTDDIKLRRPRMPDGRHLKAQPLDFVLNHWHEVLGILNRYDEHFVGWHISLGAAGAQLMEMGKNAIPPEDALQILMEYAVPMSQLGPSDSERTSVVAA